jgi:hypothetical protein
MIRAVTVERGQAAIFGRNGERSVNGSGEVRRGVDRAGSAASNFGFDRSG